MVEMVGQEMAEDTKHAINPEDSKPLKYDSTCTQVLT